jgi:hypothetical protein
MKDSYIFEYPTYILVSPDGTIISKPNNINRVGEYLAQIFAEPGESKS